MLTVAELLDDGSLGLQLVAGRAAVDREIEAAAVSELAHPGPWLQGGELLLTIGLLLPDSTDGCRSYLGELDDAGVRAVGLGLGRRTAAPAGAGPAGHRGRRARNAAAHRAGPGAVHRGHQGGVRVPRPGRAPGAGADIADPAGAHRRRGQPGRPAGHPGRAPRGDRPRRRRRRPARPGAGTNRPRRRPPRRS